MRRPLLALSNNWKWCDGDTAAQPEFAWFQCMPMCFLNVMSDLGTLPPRVFVYSVYVFTERDVTEMLLLKPHPRLGMGVGVHFSVCIVRVYWAWCLTGMLLPNRSPSAISVLCLLSTMWLILLPNTPPPHPRPPGEFIGMQRAWVLSVMSDGEITMQPESICTQYMCLLSVMSHGMLLPKRVHVYSVYVLTERVVWWGCCYPATVHVYTIYVFTACDVWWGCCYPRESMCTQYMCLLSVMSDGNFATQPESTCTQCMCSLSIMSDGNVATQPESTCTQCMCLLSTMSDGNVVPNQSPRVPRICIYWVSCLMGALLPNRSPCVLNICVYWVRCLMGMLLPN